VEEEACPNIGRITPLYTEDVVTNYAVACHQSWERNDVCAVRPACCSNPVWCHHPHHRPERYVFNICSSAYLRTSKSEFLCVVLCDIGKILFNGVFLDEVFKKQDVYRMDVLKAMFDKLANSSIMRLQQSSLDKVLK
jgi:hypothetical protein